MQLSITPFQKLLRRDAHHSDIISSSSQRLKCPHEVSVPHLRTDTKCPVLNAGGLNEDRIRINEDGCVGLDDGPPCLSSWLGGRGWSRGRDLNPRPADYESAALPLSYPGISLQRGVLTGRLSLARVWVL